MMHVTTGIIVRFQAESAKRLRPEDRCHSEGGAAQRGSSRSRPWRRPPAPCAVRALGAGFPLPYLIDDPQVSVPNQIALVEDDFRPGAFVIDALFWFALATSGALVIHRMRSRRSASIRA